MDFILDCYCGVYCGACPVLLATKSGKLGEDQQCFGCKSEKPTGFCATCSIKTCAESKGFEFCVECTEVISCDLMQKFIADQQYPYGQCVMNNMEMIRVMGLPAWLELQGKRWRCKHCGKPHSWYQESCPQCGQAVANYRSDLGT